MLKKLWKSNSKLKQVEDKACTNRVSSTSTLSSARHLSTSTVDTQATLVPAVDESNELQHPELDIHAHCLPTSHCKFERFNYVTPESVANFNNDGTQHVNTIVDLEEAVAAGDMTNAKLLLAEGIHPTAHTLKIAVTIGDLLLTSLLIREGATPTPRILEFAIESGYLDMFDLLMSSGPTANIHKPGKYGTIIQAAVISNHLAVVDRLLLAGVSTEGVYGISMLEVAAECGHAAIVERLLRTETSDDLAANAFRRGRARQAAIKGQHLDVVELLTKGKEKMVDKDRA